MSKRDAEITIGADASAAERAAAVTKSAFREAADAIKSAMGSATREVIQSLGDVALAQGKVNFSSQHGQVREFEASSARMAVAVGRDLESVRVQAEQTGVAIGKRPGEVIAWTAEVGKLTYNIDGAGQAMRGLSGLAAQTGRSVDDYKGLAVTLGTVGKVGGDTTTVIGVLNAQVDMLATHGGIAAAADQVEALKDVVSRFAVSSVDDFSRVTATALELGKGLSPAAAGRVQQSAFGALAADPLRWERMLKHSITDEHGQIRDDKEVNPATILREIVEHTKKRFGKDARRVLMLPGNFGAETGAALYNANFSEAEKAAGLAPNSKGQDAQAKAIQTDAGRRAVAEAELSVSARDLLGSSTVLGRAADAMQRFAAHNPITATLVATALGTGMSGFMVGFGKSLATMMGGKGAGGAVGGIVDLATKGAGAPLLGAAKAIPIVGSAVAGAIAGWELAGGQEAVDQAYRDEQAKKDPAKHHELTKLKEIRDRVRAAKGLPTVANGYVPTAEDTQLARDAATGAPAAVSAFSTQLQKEGVSKGDAEMIARAVSDALKTWKSPPVTIVNSTGGPVEVSTAAAESSSAGSQGGG